MKGHTKRKLQGMLAMLLAVAMVVTCVPGTAFTAYAATGQEDIQEPGVDQPAVTDDGSSETSGGGYEDDAIEEPAEDGEDKQQPSDGEEEEGMPEEETDGAEEDADDQEEEELAEYADASIMPLGAVNANLPPAVLFGINWDDDGVQINGATDGYDPWRYNGTRREGDYPGHTFIDNNYGEEIPVYFAVQSDLIPTGSTPALRVADSGTWIKGSDLAEENVSYLGKELSYSEEQNGENQEATYQYYKTTIPVDGQLGAGNHAQVKVVTVDDNTKAETDVDRAVFTISEYAIMAKYRMAGTSDWKYAGHSRLVLHEDDEIQIDFDAAGYNLKDPYADDQFALFGNVNCEDSSSILEIEAITDVLTGDELTNAQAAFDTFHREDAAGNCIFSYYFSGSKRIYYPRVKVTDAGMGYINVNAFDSHQQGLFGMGIDFTSLPDYQLKQDITQDGGAFTLGDALAQADDYEYYDEATHQWVHHDSTVSNPLALPQDKVFKFYLCDENGPLTTGNYSMVPEGGRNLNVSVNWHRGSGGGADINNDRNHIRMNKDADNRWYLEIDMSETDMPYFTARDEFGLWMDVEITDGNGGSWLFRIGMDHASEEDLTVFGVGYVYDDNDSNKKEWLNDRTGDRKADYKDNLYLYMPEEPFDDDENPAPAYVRIPKNKVDTVTAKIANGTGQTWIKGENDSALTVEELWDYTVGGTEYTYYRIDLPINNDSEDSVGGFTVTNGSTSQTYTLLGAWLQYQTKGADPADQWGDEESWKPCYGGQIEMGEGESIRFRIVGPGAFANPFGSVRVVEDNDNDPQILVGYDWNGDPIQNNSVFVTPALEQDSYERKYLEGTVGDQLHRTYGEGGNYQFFYYPTKENPTSDDDYKRWDPTFTVNTGAQGVNRMDIALWSEDGDYMLGDCVRVVVGRAAYGFRQAGAPDNELPLKNWYESEQEGQGPDWSEEADEEHKVSALLPAFEDENDNNKLKFKFYLYDASEYDEKNPNPSQIKNVKANEDTYQLGDGAEFQLRWRGLDYRGSYYSDRNDGRKNDITIKTESDNRVYLEVDLSRIKETFNYPEEEGAILDPMEWYDLELHFDMNQLDSENNIVMTWNYSYALRHEEQARDIQMFALGDWTDFSWIKGDDAWEDWLEANPTATWDDETGALKDEFVASAWQFRLENDRCNKATSSGAIVGSATCLNQERLPVYVRVPKDNAPVNAEDLLNVCDFKWTDHETGTLMTDNYSERIASEVINLGTCESGGKEYHYYRIELCNVHEDGEWPGMIDIDPYSQVPLELTLKDGSKKTFTIKGMVVRYQIAKPGKSYGEEWLEYREGGSDIALEPGDRIRLDVDGSIHPGEQKGRADNVSGEMFTVSELNDKAKDFLADRNWYDPYSKSEENDGKTYYHNLYIFDGEYESERVVNYPELTVKDYIGVSYIDFDVNDSFGSSANCGETITLSTLPKFTLRQGNSAGVLTGALPKTESEAPYEDYRNSISIPADGIFRFYLCDEKGAKVDLADPAYKGLGYEFADMDPATIKDGEPWTVADDPRIVIYPYPWDGGDHYTHFTWNNEIIKDSNKQVTNNYCYLQIDLSGKEPEEIDNAPVENNNDFVRDVWLADGFDLWMSFSLYATDEANEGCRWRFNYGYANEIALRQQGNEGNSFYGAFEDTDTGRYNLSTECSNTLLPAKDGKYRFYLYERRSDVNGINDFVPITGENPFGDDYTPCVEFGFADSEGREIIVPLYGVDEETGKETSYKNEKRVSSIKQQPADGKWYFEIDLSGFADEWEDPKTNETETLTFDPYADEYWFDVDFGKGTFKGDDNQYYIASARHYNLAYTPAMVFGWNETSNMAEELCAELTYDGVGRIWPGQKGYADVSSAYRADGSIVFYVRVPEELKPAEVDGKGTGFISLAENLEPTAGNGLSAQKANWFKKIVSVREIDDELKDRYNAGAPWTAYPVDDDPYVYYQVRLKGGAPYTLDVGAFTVTLGEASYDFTVEQAVAQYGDSATPAWKDIVNEVAVLSSGTSKELNIKSGSGEPTEGLIARIGDYDRENGAFALDSDAMPEAARTYWKDHYMSEYDDIPLYFGEFYETAEGDAVADIPAGTEPEPTDHWEYDRQKHVYTKEIDGVETEVEVWYQQGSVDWGEHYIFTYDDNDTTKTFYPSIVSNDVPGSKDIYFYAWNGRWFAWACAATFDGAAYNFRYEGDLTKSISDLKTNVFDFSKDKIKFYVYDGDTPVTATGTPGEDYGFSDGTWSQVACWFGDAEMVWWKDDLVNGISIGSDEGTGNLFIALETQGIKDKAEALNFSLEDRSYTLGMRAPLRIGDDWFLVNDSQSYFGTKGATLITGKMTVDGETHEITTTVKDQGAADILIPSDGLTFGMNMLNVDYDEVDASEPIKVTSSDDTVIRVDQDIVYVGEDKWTNSIFKNAELTALKTGTSTVGYSYTKPDGDKVSVSFTLTVKPDTRISIADENAVTITVSAEKKYAYTGDPITFDDEVTLEAKANNKPLKQNKDYTLLYENNVEAGTATLTITGMGDYTGSYEYEFEIAYIYKISFELNGGSLDLTDYVTDVFGGDYAKRPADPVREDDTFGGWFTSGSYDTEFDFEGMEITGDTTIYAKWLSKKEGFTVDPIAPLIYTGKALKPVVKVYDGDKLLTEKVDYTVKYSANTAANWLVTDNNGSTHWFKENETGKKGKINIPTVTITGKGNYQATKDIQFQILPRDINGEEFEAAPLAWVAYSGKEIKPVPVIKYSGKALKKGTDAKPADFVVEYPTTVLKGKAYQDVGVYEVVVTGTGNYTGTRSMQFGIADKTKVTFASALKVTVPKTVTYTGEEIRLKPDVEITVKNKKDSLVYGKDYDLAYRNNVKIGKATVIVKGKGDVNGGYVGVKEVTFDIVGKQISKMTLVDGKGTAIKKLPDKIYNGESQVLSDAEAGLMDGSYRLVKGKDYTVSYTKNKDAGTATILFTGINAYSGTLKKTFKIAKFNLETNADSKVKVEWADGNATDTFKYQKGATTPAVKVTFAGKVLTAGKDYTVSYANNNKGIANKGDQKAPTVTITGKGSFEKKMTKTFTIEKQAIDDSSILIIVPNVKFASGAGKYASKVEIYDTTNGKKLDNKDYTVTYKDSKGAALDPKANVTDSSAVITAVITGKGAYEGSSKEETYNLVSKEFKPKEITIKEQIYTGDEITIDSADITVRMEKNGTPLVYDQDYEIVENSYTNNIVMGKNKASVIIKGKGDYAGTKVAKFTILAKPIDK